MNDSRLRELFKRDWGSYNVNCLNDSEKERGTVFMLQLLETGQALYVLAAICLLGIMTRGITRHLYKRLLKESTNLTLTKNKSLKELRQRAENTYRMNQGLRDSGAWVEHQLYDLKVMGMTLSGWSALSMQWTWLCLLAGGAGAFLAYWYRMDTYYIVMYGGGAVLLSMFTMLFDNGMAGGWREQLVASLQDYMENVMCPRLARNMSADGGRGDGAAERPGMRSVSRLSERGGRMARGAQAEPEQMEADGDSGEYAPQASAVERGRNGQRKNSSERGGAAATAAALAAVPGNGSMNGAVSANGNGGTGGRKGGLRGGRRGQAGEPAAGAGNGEPENIRDVDYLKRSLEQIAASREKSRVMDENWLKDLKPEEVELIGDILKQYLA